jgi:hypothetical protein
MKRTSRFTDHPHGTLTPKAAGCRSQLRSYGILLLMRQIVQLQIDLIPECLKRVTTSLPKPAHGRSAHRPTAVEIATERPVEPHSVVLSAGPEGRSFPRSDTSKFNPYSPLPRHAATVVNYWPALCAVRRLSNSNRPDSGRDNGDPVSGHTRAISTDQNSLPG